MYLCVYSDKVHLSISDIGLENIAPHVPGQGWAISDKPCGFLKMVPEPN